eukprot:1013603-Rhodomonas_salina.1
MSDADVAGVMMSKPDVSALLVEVQAMEVELSVERGEEGLGVVGYHGLTDIVLEHSQSGRERQSHWQTESTRASDSSESGRMHASDLRSKEGEHSSDGHRRASSAAEAAVQAEANARKAAELDCETEARRREFVEQVLIAAKEEIEGLQAELAEVSEKERARC